MANARDGVLLDCGSTVEFQAKFNESQAAVVSSFSKIGYRVLFSPSGIPMIDREKKEVYIPVLIEKDTDRASKMIRGWVDHEMAHEIFNSEEKYIHKSKAISPKFEKIFRIIEDGRVERMESELLFGCKENLEYIEKEIIGKIKNIDVATFMLAKYGKDKVNEIGCSDFIEGMSDETLEFVSKVASCEESFQAAEMIYKDLKDKKDEGSGEDKDKKKSKEKSKGKGKGKGKGKRKKGSSNPSSMSESMSDESDDDDNDEDEGDEDEGDEDEGDEDEGDEDEGDEDEGDEDEGDEDEGDEDEGDEDEGDEDEDNENDSNDEDEDGSDGEDEKDEDGLPKTIDFTDDIKETFSGLDIAEEIAKKINNDLKVNDRDRYLKQERYIPYTKEDKIIDLSGIPGNDNCLVNRVRALVSTLSQKLLLEMQATKMLRDRYKTSGILDNRKVYQLGLPKMSKDIFYTKVRKVGLSTAVSILVDYSGSMNGRITLARDLACVLSMTMEALEIPNEVLSFTEYKKESSFLDSLKGYTRKYPLTHRIHKAFGKRMLNCIGGLSSIGSHPMEENTDGEAVLWAASRLVVRRENRKILFVLSDGMPSNGETSSKLLKDNLIDTIKMISRKGIETVGIGIETDAVKGFYKNNVVINDLGDIITKSYDKFAESIRSARVRVR